MVLDGSKRSQVNRVVQPIGRALVRLGITPDILTTAGLIFAAVAGVLIGFGYVIYALVFGVLATLPDLFDGAVAKASNTQSKRGAYFDSVADRVTDTFLLGGIAWYLQSRDGGHAAMLPLFVLASGYLISYQRAKAESLGYEAKGGLMERGERLALIGIAVAFAAQLMVPVLWLMLVLSVLTAIQRFIKVWRQAEPPPRMERPWDSGKWRERRTEVRQRRNELARQRAERRRGRRSARRLVRNERYETMRRRWSVADRQRMSSPRRRRDGGSGSE